MLKRILMLIPLCLFLFTFQPIGQIPVKYKSTEMYDFSRRLKEAVKDKIWSGFDFQDYSRARDEAGNGYIFFSTEPDNKDNEIFNWRVNDDYFQAHELEDNLIIIFHESFHAFQRDPNRKGLKWGAENAMLIFEYQESSDRNNALFSIESRILRAALQSKDTRDLKEKVSEFLAIRDLRQSELDPRFAEFEKNAELNEGLAEYAGTRAVILGMEAARQKLISVPFTEPDSEAFLNKKFKILDSIMTIGQNIRRKFYYTGSAQGFLLDRLKPEWKTEVQMEGKSPQELLETVSQKLSANQIKSVLNKYGYKKILAGEEQAVAERKNSNQTLLQNTLNQKGRKYIIDFSGLSKPKGIQNFDPMNVTMITPKVRVHTRSVTFAGRDSFTAIFSQPVVEDLEQKQYVTILPENQGEIITLDGNDVDLSKAQELRFNKSLVINSANFKFEAKTGTIKIADGEISIKLTDN